MKHVNDEKRLFRDVQQHPENYSDELIEAMMAEQDKPVDVEAAWEDFSRRSIAGNKTHSASGQRPRRIALRWWQAIAAMVVIAHGAWGMTRFYSEPLKSIFHYSDKAVSHSTAAEDKPAGPDATSRKGKSATQSPVADESVQSAPDTHPVIIVNGLKIQDSDLLSAFTPDDIENVYVWKNGAKVAAYEARFGSPAKNGVIDITLKAGRELAYADILNPNLGQSEPSDNELRIRGTSDTAPDSEPLVVVNGQRVLVVDALSMVSPDDIAHINVWKDGAKTAAYEALFGEQAKHGVIDITLKSGRDVTYADFLNPIADGRDALYTIDKMPEFSGGRAALKAYLKENLNSPAEVREAAVTGSVIVSFIVGREGQLQDVKFVRSLLKNADKTPCTDSTTINLCAEEAMRVCRRMPRWVPGRVRTDDGYKNTDIRYFLPLYFGEQHADEQKGMRLR